MSENVRDRRICDTDSAVIFIPAGTDSVVKCDRGIGLGMELVTERGYKCDASATGWTVLHGETDAGAVARLVLGNGEEWDENTLVGVRVTFPAFKALGTGPVEAIVWTDAAQEGRAYNPIATDVLPGRTEESLPVFGHCVITSAALLGTGQKVETAGVVEVMDGNAARGVNLGMVAVDVVTLVGHLLTAGMALQAVGVMVRDEMIAEEVARGVDEIEKLLDGNGGE